MTISVKAISFEKAITKSIEKKTTAHTLAVSVRGQRRGQKRRDHDATLPPPIPLIVEELDVLLDQWIADNAIALPQLHREPSDDDRRNPKYCHYHRFVHHATMDCFSLRRIYHRRVSKRLLEVPNRRQRVDKDHFPRHSQGTINVLTHIENTKVSASIIEFPDDVPTSSIRTFQRTPKFKMLFDQFSLTTDARRRATKAILTIANEVGGECLNAEAHASRAYLESFNAITFTDEDMEASYPDHRKPLYLSAQVNPIGIRRALVDTGSSLNLIPLSTITAVGISQ
ncbi:hypothetical protein SLA2020_031670 [Shorea laevis]